jgi:hypothetical protein
MVDVSFINEAPKAVSSVLCDRGTQKPHSYLQGPRFCLMDPENSHIFPASLFLQREFAVVIYSILLLLILLLLPLIKCE